MEKIYIYNFSSSDRLVRNRPVGWTDANAAYAAPENTAARKSNITTIRSAVWEHSSISLSTRRLRRTCSEVNSWSLLLIFYGFQHRRRSTVFSGPSGPAASWDGCSYYF